MDRRILPAGLTPLAWLGTSLISLVSFLLVAATTALPRGGHGPETPGESGASARAVKPVAAREPPPTPTLEGLLPDLVTPPPTEMYIETRQDGTKLLRFDTTVQNIGQGPLELISERSEDGVVEATQLIHHDDGVDQHSTGTLSFSDSHGHWHLDSFALFELRRMPYLGGFTDPVAAHNKITFCLLDELRIDPPPPHVAGAPAFLECDWEHQGISEGWSETYTASLPEQWIDITGLPDGYYELRVSLDPGDLLVESNSGNNSSVTYVLIEGDSVEMLPGQNAVPGSQRGERQPPP